MLFLLFIGIPAPGRFVIVNGYSELVSSGNYGFIY